MRRIAIIATALVVLGGSASALAAGAFNTYTTKVSVSGKAGTVKTPVPVKIGVGYGATGTDGNRTAVLTDIKTKIYGLVSNGKNFPTCTLAKIAGAKNDNLCPPGALVSRGTVTAAIGPVNDPKAAPVACTPLADWWNAGQGKMVQFFVETPAHQCAGGAIKTGDTAPVATTITQQGKWLVIHLPQPKYVTFPITGVEASLVKGDFPFRSMITRVHGKKVGFLESVGCQHGKRPFSTTYVATFNGASQTDTISGTLPCKT